MPSIALSEDLSLRFPRDYRSLVRQPIGQPSAARPIDRHAIRVQAERFGVDVFRRRFVELFERLGVDPSLYRAELMSDR